MAGSAMRFAELMRVGIDAIANRTHKPKGVIHDELGYAIGRTGGSAIAYWCYGDGHLPRDPDEIAKLARELMQRGGLDEDWLLEFLASAAYPYTAELSATLLGSSQLQVEAQPVAALQDWGDAPVIARFHGRLMELDQLRRWVVGEECRVAAIVGMGGAGKTALAARLAKSVSGEFDCVIWRSLLNAPPLDDMLRIWLRLLSRNQVAQLPATLDESLTLLLDYLREQRCLLVLDNYESILSEGERAGHGRPGYEDYDQLLRRLAGQAHRSCLLMTSREQTRELIRMEHEGPSVRVLHLAGLGSEAGRTLLREQGVQAAIDLSDDLVARYSGNPLALKLVAETIQELFGGDVAAFLGQETPLFDDIREVLDQQFDRLSTLERDLIIWLAVEREPQSLQALESNLVEPISRGETLAVVRALQRRSLVERVDAQDQGVHFALQNVVTEYASELLIETVYEEILNGQVNWLNRYGLLKAQAKEYVRQSQTRLLVTPLARRLTARLGRVGLETRLRDSLARLRRDAPLAPGYAAGNILNLLLHLEYDLAGYDFSHLAVWQAYLRGMTLHNMDFSYADLTGSVYNDSFGIAPSVTSSPGGAYLAAGTSGGEIRLWQAIEDWSFLRPHITCVGHTGWIWSVCFSPDGRILASSGEDRTVRLWQVDTGECVHILHGHVSWVRSVSFSPDGRTLASSSDDQSVRLWDVQSGTCTQVLRGHSALIRSVSFSPDGHMLASSSDDQTVRLWDAQSGECVQVLQGHTETVWSAKFNPDGRTLASGGSDHNVRLWDVYTGEQLRVFRGHTGFISSVEFSPDGRFLASGSGDQTARLWHVQTGEPLHILQGHTALIRSITFSPNGNALASSSEDQSIRLWDTQSGESLYVVEGHMGFITSVDFSDDGRMLASSSLDRTVRLWDPQHAVSLRSLKGHNDWVYSVHFSAVDNMLASGGSDQAVRLWNVRTGALLHALRGHTNTVMAVRFSPDGRILASGGNDHTVRLWDVQTGRLLRVLRGHTNTVMAVRFSPDGRILASASGDQSVMLWDVYTGTPLRALEGHASWVCAVCFSPDGRTLASGSADQTIRLWDVETGEWLDAIAEHTASVLTVCFSPDGRTLASGSADQSVRLWDAKTRARLNILQEHTNTVFSVCFSPDGRILASGSEDQTVRLWDIETGKRIHILRSSRPYEGLNITGATGLTATQVAALKVLGAVENG